MAWEDKIGVGPNVPPIPTRSELEAVGIRVAVGIPLERNITELAFRAIWGVARHGWPLVNHIETTIGYGRTDTNREFIAREFLRHPEWTHLAMLDTDHLHPWDVINRLARWFNVYQDGKPVVDAVYGMHFRRGEPYDPMMFFDVPGVGMFSISNIEDAPKGLLEVDVAAHGSMVVSRTVLESIPEPWWAYDYSDPTAKSWVSEDVFFCRKVKAHGFTQAVDTTQTSPHMTYALIDQDAFVEYRADHPEHVESFHDVLAKVEAANVAGDNA